MRLFAKLFSKSGQNIIEYAVIATLVMAGIIIGGPYVIRSWNANIHAQENTIQDSFHDPLEQAAPFGLDTDCQTSGAIVSGCGTGKCQAFEQRTVTNYTPLGCAPSQETCAPDNSCCTRWIPVGCFPGGKPPGVSLSCGAGQMVYRQACGSASNFTYKCENDIACQFKCLGEKNNQPPLYPQSSSGWCNSANRTRNLAANSPITYVDYSTCPTDLNAVTCLAQCKYGFKSVANGTSCECVTEHAWHFSNGINNDNRCFISVGYFKDTTTCTTEAARLGASKGYILEKKFNRSDGARLCIASIGISSNNCAAIPTRNQQGVTINDIKTQGRQMDNLALITAGGSTINASVNAWRKADVFNCGVGGEWVLSNDRPGVTDLRACEQVCIDSGHSSSGISLEGSTCASGEIRPISANSVLTDSVYKSRFGCWGGGSSGGSICQGFPGAKSAREWFLYGSGFNGRANNSYTLTPSPTKAPLRVDCYGPGQKKDRDTTDRRIACYCLN